MKKDDVLLVAEVATTAILVVAILVYTGRNTIRMGDTTQTIIEAVHPVTTTPVPATETPLQATERPKKDTPTPRPSETPSPTPSVAPVAKKEVESGHTFKPYTGYWAYDLKSSQQYKLQKIAITSPDNGIRIVEDPCGEWRYCVALGTYWAGGHPEHIGRCVDVIMQNGAVLKCVLADVKRQEDTKGRKNTYGEINNDLLEFIVDESVLPGNVNVKTGGNGNVSGAGKQFEGDAVYMLIYDMWIEGFGK